MIRPSDHGEAVDGVEFLTIMTADAEQQVTFVRVKVDHETTVEMEACFYVPSQTPKDASALATAMGGNPVGNAMDCWSRKPASQVVGVGSVLPVTFEQVPENSADISGHSTVAVVKLPRGPCLVTAAWSHEPVSISGGLYMFVPTQNETFQSWRMDAVVVGADTEPYGARPTHPITRSLRWDLASAFGTTFAPLENATLISQHCKSLPFHNLHFPMTKRDPRSRTHVGVSGSVIEDNTSFHLSTYCDVGFQTMPLLCGCFIKDSVNFRDAYIPTTVMERMTRSSGPFTFNDGPAGTGVVVVSIGGRLYKIDVLNRENFGGVTWVSIQNI